MNSREYLDEIAIPAIDDSLESPRNRQKAFAACTQTYHVVDYLKSETRTSATQMLKRIETGFPEFKAIHTIAAAAKHTRVDDARAYKGAQIADIKKAGPVFPCTSDGKPRLVFGRGTLVYWQAPVRIQFGPRYLEVPKLLGAAKAYFTANLEALLAP